MLCLLICVVNVIELFMMLLCLLFWVRGFCFDLFCLVLFFGCLGLRFGCGLLLLFSGLGC